MVRNNNHPHLVVLLVWLSDGCMSVPAYFSRRKVSQYHTVSPIIVSCIEREVFHYSWLVCVYSMPRDVDLFFLAFLHVHFLVHHPFLSRNKGFLNACVCIKKVVKNSGQISASHPVLPSPQIQLCKTQKYAAVGLYERRKADHLLSNDVFQLFAFSGLYRLA